MDRRIRTPRPEPGKSDPFSECSLAALPDPGRELGVGERGKSAPGEFAVLDTSMDLCSLATFSHAEMIIQRWLKVADSNSTSLVKLDRLPNRLGVLAGIGSALQRQGKHTASWMHQPAVEREESNHPEEAPCRSRDGPD